MATYCRARSVSCSETKTNRNRHKRFVYVPVDFTLFEQPSTSASINFSVPSTRMTSATYSRDCALKAGEKPSAWTKQTRLSRLQHWSSKSKMKELHKKSSEISDNSWVIGSASILPSDALVMARHSKYYWNYKRLKKKSTRIYGGPGIWISMRNLTLHSKD